MKIPVTINDIKKAGGVALIACQGANGVELREWIK